MDVEICREFLVGGPGARDTLIRHHSDAISARQAAAALELDGLRVEHGIFRDRVLRAACDRVVAMAGTGLTLEAALEKLRYSDLLLACCLEAAAPGAWELFSRRFGDFLRSATARLTREKTLAKDVAEEILGDLFFKDRDSGRSRLSGYNGSSSLERWLWTVLRSRIVDLARKLKREMPVDEIPENSALVGAAADGEGGARVSSVEDQWLDGQRRSMLSVAVPAALTDLEPKDRLLLKLVYVDGVSQREVAAMFHVHESRVSRWLDRVRREANRCLVLRLTRDHGLDVSEASELVRHVTGSLVGADFSRTLGGT